MAERAASNVRMRARGGSGRDRGGRLGQGDNSRRKGLGRREEEDEAANGAAREANPGLAIKSTI